MPRTPLNGSFEDALATLVGLGIVGVSCFFVYLALLPWHYAGVMIIVGMYLALPRRMRILADDIWTLRSMFTTQEDKPCDTDDGNI